MDGLTIGLTVGGTIVGALFTFFVSKHFFKKSINEKYLTPFIQFSSKLFSNLEPELKNSLSVTYKSHEIENLTQAQFVVANNGDLPIRDIIEPLSLESPKENKIFNVNLLHIEPEGREISFEIIEEEEKNLIEFSIPLLNSGEYFVFKILYQSTLEDTSKDERQKEDEYFFSITADDLPPKLAINRLPYSYYDDDEKEQGYNWGGIWMTLIFGGFLTSIIGVIYSFKFFSEGLYLFAFGKFFSGENFGFFSICILVLALLGIIALAFTILGLIITFSEFSSSDDPKFKVPSELRKGKKYHPIELF